MSTRGPSMILGADEEVSLASRILRASSMRALGIRSSYKGRVVNALAVRGEEGRGQLR